MAGYTSKSVLKAATSQAVAASQTKQVVSEVFPISAEDSLAFRADVTAASHSGTVSIMLETSYDGTTWIAGKAVSITGAGNATVAYLPNVAGDQTYMPLQCLGRLSVTTAGSSGVTITAAIKACRL